MALALALGVNALFLLLLLFSHARTATEPVSAAMVWIVAAIEQSRPPPRRSTSPREAARAAVPTETAAPAPAIAPAETAQEPEEPPTGIPLPTIDWYAEAGKAVRDLSRAGDRNPQKSSPEVDPEVRVRPESFWIPPKAGTTEQMEGGGTRVWTSDLCYREYNPLDPDPLTGGYRNGGRTVCKTRTMAKRLSEARAEAVADAVKRKRSGQKPEPAPDVPVSGVLVP